MNEKKKGMSRRDFGKSTVVGASAMASFGIMSQEAKAADPIKVGLIGAGGRGTGAVGNAISANKNVQLVAICDVMEETAKNAYRRLKTKYEDNVPMEEDAIFWDLEGYKKVVDMKPDYVILATPPGFRPEHFEYVVEKGVNCFCEKPIATDSNGTRRFMKAARESEKKGLSVVAGTQRRHQKEYVETVQKIHDGALGEIVSGCAYWNGTLPHARERKEGMDDLSYQLYNWYNFCWICGDNIVEQHVHNLDIMNWVLQAHPVAVTANGGRAWKPKDVEKYGNIWDHFTCDFEYPGGIHVLSMSRHWNNSANNVSELVTGTNRKYRKGQSRCNDMASERVGGHAYVQEHIDLQESILGTGPKLNEAMQVAISVFTAIMGRMSAYSGKRLKWDEALNMDYDIMPDPMDWDIEIPVRPIPVPGEPLG